MQQNIIDIWNELLNLGVSDDHPEENAFIQFYNQTMMLATISILGLIFFSICIQTKPFYLVILCSYCISNIIFLWLNAKGYIYVVRFGLAVSGTLALCYSHVALGGFFGQSASILTVLIVVHVVLANKPHCRKYAYPMILVPYCGVLFYSNWIGVTAPLVVMPYDELIFVLIAAFWAMGIVKIFENEKEELIANLEVKNCAFQGKTEEMERFTYIASHDLKSPLMTMTAFLNLIDRDINKEDSEAALEKIKYAEASVQQMTFLVEGVLELSKMKDLKKSKKTLVNLGTILDKTKISLLNYIEKRAAYIESRPLPNFWCNEVEFMMLFQNFIQNGIKYNESKSPHILISCHLSDTEMELSFRDNGIGIERKNHEKIFNYFQRLHGVAEYQGTGLGLGMCKKIIDAYDGRVEVDSVVGLGTTFRLFFPILKVNEEQNETVVEETNTD